MKAKWAHDHAARIETIQRHGITINACFILGLDGHGPEIFQEVLAFSIEHHLFDVGPLVI